MVNIILHGCNGRMGKMITDIAAEDDGVKIVAGVDIAGGQQSDYPVFEDIAACEVAADVIIDFGNAAAVDQVIEYSESRGIPLVECTTGLSGAQQEKLVKASEKTAVLKSANMSLGINVLQKALSQVSKVLKDSGFDIEIVEKHHRMKLDAPSGTAIALADTVNEALDGRMEYVYDRSKELKKRSDDEIGFSAVRGGTIVGDHDVIFAGTDEVITFSHRAYSRAIFAKGAIAAAKCMNGKKNGYYTMADVIG
ncbi:MAG: 4-hydroxy-tetrahydrodipicolinate reductase [Lachnospiraceae bacterium]|nr:4-hydroxy-tetrahydrodipicolinate reductase [Lachnospiraceae bacterium]